MCIRDRLQSSTVFHVSGTWLVGQHWFNKFNSHWSMCVPTYFSSSIFVPSGPSTFLFFCLLMHLPVPSMLLDQHLQLLKVHHLLVIFPPLLETMSLYSIYSVLCTIYLIFPCLNYSRHIFLRSSQVFYRLVLKHLLTMYIMFYLTYERIPWLLVGNNKDIHL